jgi:hypothetical protein
MKVILKEQLSNILDSLNLIERLVKDSEGVDIFTKYNKDPKGVMIGLSSIIDDERITNVINGLESGITPGESKKMGETIIEENIIQIMSTINENIISVMENLNNIKSLAVILEGRDKKTLVDLNKVKSIRNEEMVISFLNNKINTYLTESGLENPRKDMAGRFVLINALNPVASSNKTESIKKYMSVIESIKIIIENLNSDGNGHLSYTENDIEDIIPISDLSNDIGDFETFGENISLGMITKEQLTTVVEDLVEISLSLYETCGSKLDDLKSDLNIILRQIDMLSEGERSNELNYSLVSKLFTETISDLKGKYSTEEEVAMRLGVSYSVYKKYTLSILNAVIGIISRSDFIFSKNKVIEEALTYPSEIVEKAYKLI